MELPTLEGSECRELLTIYKLTNDVQEKLTDLLLEDEGKAKYLKEHKKNWEKWCLNVQKKDKKVLGMEW